jgi:SPP1 gp7 family putative phage head morphogenesis protein
MLAKGIAQGKTPKEVAAELLPHVKNYRASAMRIARMGCMRVANTIKEEASKSIDSLIAGKQMHALLDLVTRPLHRARSGLVWLKDSGVDMQTALRMEGPTLPDDYNCRCHLSDIMRPPSWVKDQAKLDAFRARTEDVAPDHAVYSEWFAQADERQRRIAVGTRRYSAAKEVAGDEALHYSHFVNEKGELLSVDQIQTETAEERAARIGKIKAEEARRRHLIRELATFGFLPE